MTRVVFMDVGNVLVDFDLKRLLRGFLGNSSASSFQVIRFLRGTRLDERYEKGEVSTDEVFALAHERLGFQGDLERFKEAWNDIFQENAEGVALFRELKRRLPVYLLSNTNELHFEYLRKRFAFIREADGEVLSHEVKARKPEKAMYEAALARAGAAPGEAFYIDDIPAYVEAAGRLGIPGAVFKDGPSMRRYLAEAGLL